MLVVDGELAIRRKITSTETCWEGLRPWNNQGGYFRSLPRLAQSMVQNEQVNRGRSVSSLYWLL